MKSTKRLCFIVVFTFFMTTKALTANTTTQTWHLKDGTKITGTLIKDEKDYIRIKTTFGEKKILKNDLAKIKIEILLFDSSLIYGELLKETQDTFTVKTSLGILNIKKTNIDRFQIDKDKTDKKTTFKDRSKEKYSHTIEPLIDIFFDPTGHTFNEGDFYISGLSIAYGISNSFLASVNVVELTGLNQSSTFNPNIELKKKIIKHQNPTVAHHGSIGIRAQAANLNGYTKTTYKSTYIDENECKLCKRIKKEKISSETVRPWLDYQNDEPLSSSKKTRYEYEFSNITGWQTQMYYAHTLSFLMNRGGRLSLHAGVFLTINDFIKEISWWERPSYRAYSGFDVDISKKFKILGEIFYDPDFYNRITQKENIGVDIGVMWAITESFRLLLHVQMPIIGLYWRY